MSGGVLVGTLGDVETRAMRRGTTPATAAASWRVRLILHRLYSACRASSCRDTGLVRPRKGSSLGMVPASCTHRTSFSH